MSPPPHPTKCLTHYHEPKYRMYPLLRKTLQFDRALCSGSNQWITINQVYDQHLCSELSPTLTPNRHELLFGPPHY